jgi:hypothetical protein
MKSLCRIPWLKDQSIAEPLLFQENIEIRVQTPIPWKEPDPVILVF